jgi:DMSO reductase anchor subunit
VAGLALGASTLHLGRPAHAYRALRMWRRSWLSREVLMFSSFSGVASAYAAMLWFGVPGSAWVGALTTLLGVAGVVSSACIYLVPARPAWNSWHTVADFLLTAGVLGPLFTAATGAGQPHALAVAAAAAACAHFALVAAKVLSCVASDSPELKGTVRLLSTTLLKSVLWRGALLALGAIVLPLSFSTIATMAGGLLLTLGAQILGRYLFFVSVVPKHLAAPYLAAAREAA